MRLPLPSSLMTCLLLAAATASADPIDISADRAAAPPRTEAGTGLCVSAIHVNADGILTNTSDATVRLDLNVGDAGIDGKVSGLRFPALNFRNAQAASVGDFTGAGSEESLFPFSNDAAAQPQSNDKNFAIRGRALLGIPKAGLYTVGVNSETGFRLTVAGLLVARSPAGQSGRFSQQVRFAAPGLYPIELIHYSASSAKALLEVSLAEGGQAEVSASQTAFDPAVYQRVGSASLYSAAVSEGNCQECSSDAACGPGAFCGDLKLCQLCLLDSHCGPTCNPCTAAQPFCSSGQCVECTSERDASCVAKKQVCKALTSTCGPCTDSLECKGQICRGDGTCGPCQVDGQCPDNQLCDAAAGLCYTRLCSDTNREPCAEKGQICNVDRGICRGCVDDNECLLLSPTLQCDQGAKRCVARRDLRYQGGCSVGGAEPGDASLRLLGVVALCLLLLSAHAARGLRRARSAAPATSLRPRAARRRRPQGIVLLLLLLAAPAARAQVTMNAQTFRPAVGPENVITVDGTRTPGHLTPMAAVVFDFAYHPLRLYDGTAGLFVANTVPTMATAHVQLGVGLSRFFFLGASLPVVVYQGFDNGTAIVDPRVTAPAPFGIGDLRLAAKLRFLDNQDHGFGIALAPQVSFPTGQGASFRGDDSFDIEPRLVADYKFRQGTFITLNAGFQARTADQVLADNRVQLADPAQLSSVARISHQVRYGAGVYAPIAKGLGVGGEIQGGVSLATADTGDRYMPLEGAALVRWAHKGGFNVSVGGGGAFIGAPGIPLFRAFASIGYLPIGRPLGKPKAAPAPPVNPDPDGDGVSGDDDRCPDQAGPPESRGCPYLDSDGDGVLDKLDGCPREPGPLAYRGCPESKADRDGDGVLDRDDACPEQAGVAAARGCPAPADRDKDGVADADDRCPEQAGVADNGGCPDLDGDGDGLVDRLDRCPKEAGPKDAGGCPPKPAQQAAQAQPAGALSIGADGTVKLAQPIRFAAGGDALDPASAAVVTALAKLVQEDGAIKKLQVAVPTTGAKKAAKKLAGLRAKALTAALTQAGVAKKLLAVKPGKGLEGDVIAEVAVVKGKAKGGKGKKQK